MIQLYLFLFPIFEFKATHSSSHRTLTEHEISTLEDGGYLHATVACENWGKIGFFNPCKDGVGEFADFIFEALFR